MGFYMMEEKNCKEDNNQIVDLRQCEHVSLILIMGIHEGVFPSFQVVCLSNIGIVLCSKASCRVSQVRKGGEIGSCLLSQISLVRVTHFYNLLLVM